MLRRLCVTIYLALGLEGTGFGKSLRKFVRQIGLGSKDAPETAAPPPPVYVTPQIDLTVSIPDTDGILVAFKIGGGIGDHLLAARYIRDLIAAVGEFRFDIYSSRPDTATWIFSQMPQFNRCYDEYFSWHGKQYYRLYAAAMWISQFVVLQYEAIDWVRLNNELPKLVRVCETMDRFRHARDLNEIISAHPRLDNLLGLKASFMNCSRNDFSHAMSGIDYGGHALHIPAEPARLEKFGLKGRAYVTIHNGFDAEFQTAYGFASKSTKVYARFDAVVELLRAQRPDIFIVQLGTKTSQPIKGVNLQLVGKTSLSESAAILAGAMLHVDNESGLVHMAACLGTISCVVFGPTPAAYFGYDQNINILPRECGGCWWVNKDWMTNCPRGMAEPVCTAATPPQSVADAVLSALGRLDSPARLPAMPALGREPGPYPALVTRGAEK